MIKLIRKILVLSLLPAASLALGDTASSDRAPAPRISTAAPAAPAVVTNKVALSAADLAKYQEKAEASQAAASDKAAGASGDKTTLIVIGVIVVVAVVALAAGGGGGGGY